MTRRALLILLVLCLAAASCGGSASDAPAGDSETDAETPATDVDPATDTGAAGCNGQAITEGEAVAKAREIATEVSGQDIAFGFFDSGDVVAEGNARDDFWEVTFTKDSGAVEIYLTCSGELASVGTNGDAIP